MRQGQQGTVYVPGAQVVTDKDLLFGVFRRGQEEVAASPTELFTKYRNEQNVVRVFENVFLVFRYNERHRARPTGGEVSRRLIDRISEGFDGGVDRGDDGRPDVATPVQDP